MSLVEEAEKVIEEAERRERIWQAALALKSRGYLGDDDIEGGLFEVARRLVSEWEEWLKGGEMGEIKFNPLDGVAKVAKDNEIKLRDRIEEDARRADGPFLPTLTEKGIIGRGYMMLAFIGEPPRMYVVGAGLHREALAKDFSFNKDASDLNLASRGLVIVPCEFCAQFDEVKIPKEG